jgi:hypothetical protein
MRVCGRRLIRHILGTGTFRRNYRYQINWLPVSAALLESAFDAGFMGVRHCANDYCVSFRRNIYMTGSFPAS